MLGWSHIYDGVGLHICLTNKRSLGDPIVTNHGVLNYVQVLFN